MQPLAPGRLDEGRQTQSLDLRLHHLGGSDYIGEVQPFVWVQVESDLVRDFRLARGAAPWMQLQPARLGDRDQTAHIERGDIGRARLDSDQLQARVRPRHCVTLEEGLAGDALRRANDRGRPVRHMGQNPLGRRFIVARQIGLGDRRPVIHGGPQHLVGT
ncbi:hypothetical protein D3C80_1616810 [compost metagenome]